MKRALSIDNLRNQRFRKFGFTGEMFDFVGDPEMKGSWLVWGNSSNGKTVFAAKLAKFLSQFKRVNYNSLEEGASASLLRAFDIADIEQGDKITILDKEPMDLFIERLRKHKSADVNVIDSFQYTELNKANYKALLNEFPNKLFIFISHAEGKEPAGRTAKSVKYDANVKIWIEGFKAFPKSRYGGGEPYVIWEKGADLFWNK